MEVSFSLPTSLNQCTLLLNWNIPSGAYVDPYQLESLADEDTNFLIGKVDIEQTQHNSPPLVFHQLSKLHCKQSCQFIQTIPFHSRYHSPNHGGNPATVTLSPPKIFTSCDPSSGCIDDNNPSCGWKPLSVSFESSSISYEVPVGDLSHVTLVTALTLAITLLGTIFTALK